MCLWLICFCVGFEVFTAVVMKSIIPENDTLLYVSVFVCVLVCICACEQARVKGFNYLKLRN
jgi:hypothetical protein